MSTPTNEQREQAIRERLAKVAPLAGQRWPSVRVSTESGAAVDVLANAYADLSWALSRIEELAKDARRLDWMEANGGVVAGDLTGGTLCGEAEFGWKARPTFGELARPLREAIDATISRASSSGANTP